MCEPTTIMAVATVASTALGAYGQIEEGRAAQEAYNYQAQVQRNNAIMERNKAAQERAKGELEEIQKRREIAKVIGRQRAAVGASGVEMSGSPLDVYADSVAQGTFDIALIRYNAEQRARDREFAAQNYDAEAELSVFSGRSARRAGFIGAAGTALSGASSLAGMSNFGGKSGGFGKKSTARNWRTSRKG